MTRHVVTAAVVGEDIAESMRKYTAESRRPWAQADEDADASQGGTGCTVVYLK